MNLINRILSKFDLMLVRASALDGGKGKGEGFEKMESIEVPSEWTNKLRSVQELSLEGLFGSDERIRTDWEQTQQDLEKFRIPDGTGGVNPGDQRAIFYLIHKLRPSSVLEVGTHIGASTVHIASALAKRARKEGEHAHLTTLDRKDVNSELEEPWKEYGAEWSPKGMIEELGYGDFVDFIVGRSTDHFEEVGEASYDFIFLDGGHSASNVYKEIPGALKALRPGGVILLHDYFPDLQPLWKGKPLLKGPYRAVKRFKEEGVGLEVLPLGELPWPTKNNSNVTSLALLLKP